MVKSAHVARVTCTCGRAGASTARLSLETTPWRACSHGEKRTRECRTAGCRCQQRPRIAAVDAHAESPRCAVEKFHGKGGA
eukprot:1034408-Alexandrium_andersonii.AAC.1